MTVGKLNALLDALRDASTKKPGVTNTPGSTEKARKKGAQESTKGSHLRSIVSRVDQAELHFVLNVILKAEKGHGAGGCDTFMKHVHEDAYDVMDTCVTCSFLLKQCCACIHTCSFLTALMLRM